MKRILPLLCIALLTLALSACNQEPSVKIGVVDEAAAFKDNKVTTEAMTYLKEMGKPLQDKAEAAYKKMQANQNEETVAAYKLAMGELQTTMNAEQQRIVAMVDAKFNEVLEQYRQDKKLTLILNKQSVIASDKTVDVTKDIIAVMNTISIDFTKPKAPAKPEATAPKAAPAVEKTAPAEPTKEAPAKDKTKDKAAE